MNSSRGNDCGKEETESRAVVRCSIHVIWQLDMGANRGISGDWVSDSFINRNIL